MRGDRRLVPAFGAYVFAVFVFAAFAAMTSAFAQPQPADPTPPPTHSAKPAPKSPPPADKAVSTARPADSKPTTGTSAVVMDLSTIDGLIGRSVKSSAGEDMGRIADLLVTPAGQIRAAVIDFGGILGVGSRKIAVDWKALSFANITKNGTVDLALSRNEVRVAPEFKSGDPVVIMEAPKAIKTTPSEATTPAVTADKPASVASPAADAKPSDAKPSDAKPSDAKPSDAKPSDAKPSPSAK